MVIFYVSKLKNARPHRNMLSLFVKVILKKGERSFVIL